MKTAVTTPRNQTFQCLTMRHTAEPVLSHLGNKIMNPNEDGTFKNKQNVRNYLSSNNKNNGNNATPKNSLNIRRLTPREHEGRQPPKNCSYSTTDKQENQYKVSVDKSSPLFKTISSPIDKITRAKANRNMKHGDAFSTKPEAKRGNRMAILDTLQLRKRQ